MLLAGGGALVVTGLRSSTAPLSLFTGAAAGPTSSLHMVRPLDMLVLDFDFYNLLPALDADPPVLRRVDPFASASIVAHFASQHVMEQTIYADVVDPPAPGAAVSKGVGPSRIVFAVPDTVNVLAYSEQGLLQWWQWVMRVVAGPSVPDDLQTDLLLVDWLHLTPDQQATWAHASEPVTHGGRTELWHTRLSLRDKDGKPQESIGVSTPADSAVATVRAVYADKPASDDERKLFGALFPEGFNNPPEQIVRLSSDPAVPAHKPVRADLLSLSAAGSTLDLAGQWAPVAGFDLKGWEHHSWLGRDNKVVIEEYGFLFPFGHRAELTAETKRLVDEKTGVAYLRQRRFIRITQRVKTYPAPYQPSGGRAFPFADITITNTALPDLPSTVEPLVAGNDTAFWIQDINAVKPDGKTHSDVVFAVVATDLSGRRIEFTTPMAFMPGSASVNPTDPLFVSVRNRFGGYAGVADPPLDGRRVIDLRGQEVSYAWEEQPGTASFPTIRWYWGVDSPPPDVKPQVLDSPVFYPNLLAGEAQIPAVDATIGPGGPVFLVHDKAYLAGGFGHNKALAAAGNDPQIFVRVQDSIAAIAKLQSGAGDSPVSRTVDNSLKSGGIATPNLQVGAISLALGAVSGSQDSIDKVQDSGKIDFKAYFPDLGNTLQQAALFGEILLGHLFEDGYVSSHGFRISKQTDYPKDKNGNLDRTKKPTGQTVMLSFQAQPVSTGPLLVTKDPAGHNLTGFVLDCVNRVDYLARNEDTSDKATITVYGILTNFSLDLSPIILSFTKFGFEYQVGGKPKFQPEIESVKFKEPLDFINTIQKFISGVFGNSNESGGGGGGGGGSGPPAPDKKPKLGFALMEFDIDQIGLGVKLDVPSLPLGLFSLEGISFTAGVILPFNPVSPIPFQRKRALVRARFGFGTSADKFKVTVYGLGGGGHFTIEVSTAGVEVLDASIEIVGNLAVDLFVAAGRLTIEAGIYFHLDNTAGVAVTLRGFVKATGRLSVIGLINITAEFYADLEYVNKDGHAAVTGHAHVTVSIDILFFHTSVSVEFQKTFVGSDTNSARALASAARTNTFGDLVSRDDWNLYCASFAG
ncbi:MAG TPA: hypothetical protein VGP31_03280 [Planosporangium sp.]|nr:hypothetical protein [Planosporangium sp.]